MYMCFLPRVSQSEAYVMYFQAKKHLLLQHQYPAKGIEFWTVILLIAEKYEKEAVL